MLILVSANHHGTPFETLERLSAVGNIARKLTESHEHIRGAVVLATCNRFEAYLDIAEDSESPSPEPATTAALHDLAELAGVPFRQLRDEVSFAHGNGVARHLFAVSSGLDSVVIGEGEIAGQVRRALEHAREQGLTTPSLEQLFQRATETSKRVKSSTALTESGRSLVRLSLELASGRVADWASARVLLIGTGRYAAVTLASLRALGVTDVRVSSASAHGAQFASSHELPLISATDSAAFSAEVRAADVIIACTTRDSFVLEPGDFGVAGASRPSLVIDLGLPRNVDPAVASVPHVSLLDLETIRQYAPIDEFAHLAAAHDIVDEAARSYGSRQRAQDVSAAVIAVRGLVNELVDQELDRLGGDPATRTETERALRHLAGVLLHRVTSTGQQAARSGQGDEWMRSAASVFGLEQP